MSEEYGIDEPVYHVSSHSGGSDCVAVAKLGSGNYIVRHSRSQTPAIEFSRREWKAFIAGVKESEFDF